MPSARVEIVVLTFDAAPGMLEDAVCSVLDTTSSGELDVGVHVVDNGSSASRRLDAVSFDGRPVSERVRVTTTGENLGYAGGMNVGLDASPDADVIVLLNDDVVVRPGWLDPLVAEFEAPDVGAAQPLLVDPDRDAINSAGVTIDRYGAGSDRLRDEPVSAAGIESTDLAVFTGGAVALSRAFIDDVGGFDDRFFLYYEDVELARRGARSAQQWRYRLVPSSIVEHRGSVTTEKLGDRVVYLRERNRIWSAASHGDASELVGAIQLSVRRLRHRPHRVHARALVAALSGSLVRLFERAGRSRLPRAVRRRLGSLATRRRARRVAGTTGVNIVGYHHISSGLGSIARELSAALQAADIPVCEVDNDLSSSPRRRPARPIPTELYDTTIAIVTAFEFEYFAHRFPELVGPGKRTIACWLWELEEIPDQHVAAARVVDELWVPSTFIRDAYRAALDDRIPVRLAPFPMEEPSPPTLAIDAWRERWADDEVVFLTSFDYLSIVERKNPVGAIRAFRLAFGDAADPTSAKVRLIVKSINAHERPDDFAAVAAEAGDDRRIELIDEHLDDDAHHGLIAAADVLVSLHRSEGIGLHPAIAMRLGTPVIATRYSAVLDFLDDDVAAMVDHTMVEVTNGQGIYPESATWAEPDVADAARRMRELAEDPELRVRLGTAGRDRIAGQPSSAQFGEGYAALLRTPSHVSTGDPGPFFDGLDAARNGVIDRVRRVRRGLVWPDTARRRSSSARRGT